MFETNIPMYSYARVTNGEAGVECSMEYYTAKLTKEQLKEERKKDGTISLTFVEKVDKRVRAEIIGNAEESEDENNG